MRTFIMGCLLAILFCIYLGIGTYWETVTVVVARFKSGVSVTRWELVLALKSYK